MLAFIAFILILSQDILREVVLFTADVNDVRGLIEEEIKVDIKNEVDIHLEEIEQMYFELEDDIIAKNEKSLTRSLPFINAVIALSSEDDLVEILSVLEVVDCDTELYIIDTAGIMRYDGSLEQEVTVDVLEEQDVLNHYYYQDLVDHKSTTEYYSVEVYLENNTQLIITGIQITGTNYMIYTVTDKVGYMNELVQEYALDLSSHYLGDDESIFIISDTGYIFYHNNEAIIGLEVDDIDGVVHENLTEIMTYLESHQDGYLVFPYTRQLHPTEELNRINYSYHYEEAGIIIGFSRTTEEYDYMLTAFLDNNLRSTLAITIPIYVILIVIFVYGLYMVKRNNQLAVELVKEEEELYRAFSDLGENIILITEKNGDIIYTNKLGKEVIFDDRDFSIINLDEIMIDEGKSKIFVGAKENLYVEYNVTNVIYNGNECELYVFDNVTDTVGKQRELEAMSLNDDLTGLGNRRLMAKEYQDTILPSIRTGADAFLVMIDLDNFKHANDLYGHRYGDEVLKMIGKIFRDTMNDSVSIYRVGGDEFAMFTMNMTDNETVKLLRHMLNLIAQLNLKDNVNIGFSAGIIKVSVNDDLRRFSDYYEKADRLLYEAKEEGKHRIKI
jgi:diguanylate cyclase (GGDEF)-like protein